jgi:hypothetical protein
VDAATIVALAVGLGGWIAAGATTWLNYKAASEANFYRALDWLSGGTQKRNLGIAAVEGAWHTRRVRRLSTPLLCSSAVYLLLRSDERDSANELNNLYRIMYMLTARPKINASQVFHYRLLLSALGEKLEPGFIGGLDVSSEKVNEWRSKVIAFTSNANGALAVTQA